MHQYGVAVDLVVDADVVDADDVVDDVVDSVGVDVVVVVVTV